MVLVYKQARAVVDDRTTIVCLDIHGVMVPVDQPFDTLAGDFMAPPFHVHCRTLVGPHMPGFVAQARMEANAELVSRPKSQRRKGPGGVIGADIPRPVTSNTPVGFSRAVEDHRLAGVDAELKNKALFTPKPAVLPALKADWVPAMTREAADAFVSDSVVTRDVFHGTPSIEAAAAITAAGFDSAKAGTRSGDKGFSGEGFYFSLDQSYAGQYAAVHSDRPGKVLTSKVRLLNPWIDNPDIGETSLEEFVAGWDREHPKLSRKDGRDLLAAALREEAIRRGHDGVIAYYGGLIHEIVVFAKESVVIVLD